MNEEENKTLKEIANNLRNLSQSMSHVGELSEEIKILNSNICCLTNAIKNKGI